MAAAAQDDFLQGLPMRAGMASGKARRVGALRLLAGPNASDPPGKPVESRGSYRVNEIAWSEKVYRGARPEKHKDL